MQQERVVTIVGTGLIGGSLALALKESGFASSIIAVESCPTNRELAIGLNIADRALGLEESIVESDTILLALPVDGILQLLPKILDLIAQLPYQERRRKVVADMGSTKREICKRVKSHPLRAHFVALHPIAGTQFSGPEAASPTLFRGKNMILCDLELSSPFAIERASLLIEALEMRGVEIDSSNHDIGAAYLSHLSHITSFSLALTLLDNRVRSEDIVSLAASGFESTVRLAVSSPKSWSPIFEQNREAVIESIDLYMKKIELFKLALQNGESETLFKLMERANEISTILK